MKELHFNIKIQNYCFQHLKINCQIEILKVYFESEIGVRTVHFLPVFAPLQLVCHISHSQIFVEKTFHIIKLMYHMAYLVDCWTVDLKTAGPIPTLPPSAPL